MADLADAIWGPWLDADVRVDKYRLSEKYIDHCESDIRFASRGGVDPEAARANLINALQTLKANPTVARSAICPPTTTATSFASSGSTSPGNQTCDLGLAVNIMLSTACSSPDRVGGDIFKPSWKESETLCQFVDRVYPQATETIQDSRLVQIHKLSVGYLASYAGLKLKWTHRLSDHLVILRGEGWKSLYIFQHPSFLTVSLETLRGNDADMGQTIETSLSLGCLPPGLLREALMTINLLFPTAGDPKSRGILQREVAAYGLDPGFLQPSWLQDQPHDRLRDALDPVDIRALYEKYPYWGERLYDIWREADDPTPITAIERWTEAKRNPRFTYWCTVVAVSLAVLFGITATAMGAVQVWIAYCDWAGEEGRPLCRT